MFKYDISKVADTLIGQASLFNCSLAVAWEKYVHPAITEQFTFNELEQHIKEKIELGERYEAN